MVFDPGAGAMNADGWFNSPLGAFPTNPAFTGKVHFQSNAAYDKATNVLTGMLRVSLPNMDFSATSFDWLSITGSKLQATGGGKINGVGSYRFLLSGIDGKLDGNKLPDKARIKIWDQATGRIIFDSQMEAVDSAAPIIVLGGGTVNNKR